MVRNIVVFVGAVIVCGVAITLVQMIGHAVYPPPPGMDPNDPTSITKFMADIPLGALLMVELSYIVGSFCGGWVAARFAASRAMWLAGGVGAFFTVANIFNLTQIPHPLWMAVLTMITFVPVALSAGRLAGGNSAAS